MIADFAGPDASSIATRREGSAGQLPAEVATPLALVLTELLQNAVEHAFGPAGGHIVILARAGRGTASGGGRDDGAGLPTNSTSRAHSGSVCRSYERW